MNKLEFFIKIKETRQEYESSLAALTEAQMLRPRTCGKWSVKDVIAHIAWYERQMIGVLKQCALLGSDLCNLPLEVRNAAIHAENKDRSLTDVLAEARQVYPELLEPLAGLSEEELQNPACFREMPPGWIPLEVIASNTFEHYPVHTADICKAFLAQ
jgi:uncharacterized protein (TIGR03083 family)